MAGRGATKERMTISAVKLLQERGVNGVTIDAVLADSGAPRGSVYHHFPGGRAELVLTAAQTSADFITSLIERQVGGEPEQAVLAFVDFWTRMLDRSDYRAGCPIAALISETSEELSASADLARATFKKWERILAGQLAGAGRTPEQAEGLAAMIISTVEGAITLCRADRSAKPLDLAAHYLTRLLAL